MDIIRIIATIFFAIFIVTGIEFLSRLTKNKENSDETN